MRVLVCGGRYYDNWKAVSRTLSELEGVTLIINGQATGADRLSARWAVHHHVPVSEYPANWNFLGKKAGPMRNMAMLKFGQPDLVVAFPGGRGTQHMIDAAKAAGIRVMEVAHD